LRAPTGSGKTTALPPALLEEEWLEDKKILLLEPRRLAVRLAASFMAGKYGEQVGQTIGYRVRFERRVSPRTRLEVMTEGMLIRRLQEDPELSGVGMVIFDEFHERSLEGDLCLGLCRDVQQGLREDLRLLVMSATLDCTPLAKILGGAPVLECGGTLYPVETRYLPPTAELDSPRPDHIARMTARAIRHALGEEEGDLLVFLPGQGEIKRVQELLGSSPVAGSVVLALYGALSLAEQNRAVSPDPGGRRRIILATTVAESSLTIEGISVVVDCGWKRAPRFDAARGLSRLETVRISRAAARQRSGRAGRLGPGISYRLWSRGLDGALRPFDRPEILQADLAPLLLELALWGVQYPDQLCWLDPPEEKAVARARSLLLELEALDSSGRISETGKKMAALPLHPRLAHMLLQARGDEEQRLACDIAALMGERDIILQPQSVDVDDRLHVLERFRRQGRLPGGCRSGTCRRAARVSQQLLATLKDENKKKYRGRQKNNQEERLPGLSAAALLSLAFPDRIGARRSDRDRGYTMVNGSGVVLPEHDRLRGAEFLVVAALNGAGREGRVFLAASLDREELLQLHGHRCRWEAEVAYRGEARAVQARESLMLGRMVVRTRMLANPDPQRVACALLAEIRKTELRLLPWNREARELQQRVICLAALDSGRRWPDFSSTALQDELEQWLGPWLVGMKGEADLRRLDLAHILLQLLEWPLQKRLAEEAPTHIRVPGGSRVRLSYREEGAPVLAVRLQELFGLTRTPTIGRGRIKVLLHLLSPARRPVQITDDLEGFWKHGYPEVKKELQGRYPKHFWPDNPLTATATNRVRPPGKKG